MVASYDKNAVTFSKTQTSVFTSLVLVVSISVIMPTVMAFDIVTDVPQEELYHALILSRGTAIVLFALFTAFMLFRFKTHEKIFSLGAHSAATRKPTELRLGAQLSISSASGLVPLLYLCVTAAMVICANYMISTIDETVNAMGVTKSLMGLIILPLVGHASKSSVIVITSRKRRLDSAIRAIMINVLDTLLFVAPGLVLLGWSIGMPMMLQFDFFEATLLLLAMIVLTNLLQHGKTTYFEGIMLIGT